MHRMSFQEVEEVARLAAVSGARPQGGGPTVHKVADALGLAPSDVQSMLDQARQGGSPIRDFKVVMAVAAIALAFVLGIGFTNLLGHRPVPQPSLTSASNGVPQSASPAAESIRSSGPPAQTVRQSSPGAASALDASPSNLSAELAPLEAKTVEGDLRNTKRHAKLATSVTPIDGDPLVLTR